MAAEHRLESCGKGTRPEGLGDVVVGTELEYSHFVVLVSLGREHHDRNVSGGGPRTKLLQNPVAVETGEVEKAKENVALLQKICPAGCEELEDLREAIALAPKTN